MPQAQLIQNVTVYVISPVEFLGKVYKVGTRTLPSDLAQLMIRNGWAKPSDKT